MINKKTGRFVVYGLASLILALLLPAILHSQPEYEGSRYCPEIYYETQCLVVRQDAEVVAVRFVATTGNNAKYVYRHLTKDGKTHKGTGTLTLKKAAKKDPNEMDGFFFEYDREAMTIKVGEIRLVWRGHSDTTGMYFYHPEIMSVQVVDTYYFDDLDLKRFQKKK